jgi:hypothetical protein
MFKEWSTTFVIAGVLLLAAPLQGSSQAAPAMKPQITKSDGITLVGRKGGGRGLEMRGGGRKFGGFRGGGRKFSRGGGARRFSHRGFRSFKGFSGRKHAGKFRHRRHHGRKHRKSRSFAIYGVPYVYGWYDGYSCGWLHRRAIRTGSPYWWRRYYACRHGYYDY